MLAQRLAPYAETGRSEVMRAPVMLCEVLVSHSKTSPSSSWTVWVSRAGDGGSIVTVVRPSVATMPTTGARPNS